METVIGLITSFWGWLCDALWVTFHASDIRSLVRDNRNPLARNCPNVGCNKGMRVSHSGESYQWRWNCSACRQEFWIKMSDKK